MSVLDASVYVAYLSPSEHHHEQALRLWDGYPPEEPFAVPAVFRLEVIAAMARRGESSDVLDAIDALARGPKFEAVPLSGGLLDTAARVARAARLRAYDALYAALALERGCPLLTLDGDVARRLGKVFPDLEVRTR
jgi:predicted nucleic acid-binding protein